MTRKKKTYCCVICGEMCTGNGKYCPPPKPCREAGKRNSQASYARLTRAGNHAAPGQYGERRAVLLKAYEQASPERRREMLGWHADLNRMLKKP